ncbi:MAG TPA: hypothetical protein VKF62_13570, partial [Planctomycetota bacterium]|nr:hypothetical protein [Planctomycetota bacterium]
MIPPFLFLVPGEPHPGTSLAQDSRPDSAEGGSESIEEVRAALRGRGARAEAVELAGEGEYFGLPSRFTLLVARDGRFRRRIESRIVVEDGFDGKRTWTVDDAGLARELLLRDRELVQLAVGVATGTWADAGGPFLASVAAGSTGGGRR